MLLRTLITLCSTLSPLPRERWITMQLYYYDDITVASSSHTHSQPPDYQPTFFEDSAQALVRPGDSPFVSSPFVVEEIRGFGEVPRDMITVSSSISNSKPFS